MVNAKDLENEVKNKQDVENAEAKSKKGTASDATENTETANSEPDVNSGEQASEEAATESDDGSDSEDTTEKKGFFKKKDKKDKKDEKIEELNDRVMRTMAEFDNFRKRSEREKSQMFDLGVKDIVEKILPVVDNMERGLSTVSPEAKEDAFVQGMEKVYKQLMTTLETAGVTPIEAVGTEFNPDFHNAVMHIEDENFGENIIAEEFQKGYMYKESVVRHSMVKVAN